MFNSGLPARVRGSIWNTRLGRGAVAGSAAALLILGTGAAAAAASGGRASAGGATARSGHTGSGHRGWHPRPLPAHVFSPYFEAYTTDSPAALSSESGAKYLTLAFLQTPSAGSCDIDWNGNTSTPVSPSVYGADIAKIRESGGDVVPSFGGYSADTTGTEIADSCTSVPAIAAVYEKVVTTYGVTRLDMDVEGTSLTNTAGIDRRNKAIALVEHWAARTHRVVQFVYTIPTFVAGLTSDGVAVLQNAVENHARITIVNIMTFDYYDGQPHEMGQDSITAAGHLYDTLHALYPNLSRRQLWGMVGLTNMVGIDDYGPPEVFTLADAGTVEQWAASTGIGELSFWALERDNGGCPGVKGSDSCSGLAQNAWQFTSIFAPFTRR